MIAAMVLSAILFGSLYVFGWQYDLLDQPLTLALALAIPAAISFVILAIRDRDLLSPLHLLLYLVVWSVTLKTVYFLHFDPAGESLFLSSGQISPRIIYGGLVLTATGLAAFVIGYLVTLPQSLPARGPIDVTRHQKRVLTALSVTIFLIAAAAIYTFLAQTNSFSEILRGQIFVKRLIVGEGGQRLPAAQIYLRILGQILPQIGFLALLAVFWTRPDLRRRHDFYLLALLGLAACAIPLLASSRLTLAYFGISVMLMYHYLVRPLSLPRMTAFGLIALVVLGVLGELRRSQTSIDADEGDFRIVQFVQNTLGRPYFLDVGKTAAVYDAVPDRVDFIDGASIARLIYAPIPRAIWPEKPILAINVFIQEQILGREDESGVPPGAIAELYLNYGYPAVICGMLLAGLLAGWNYRGLRKRAGRSIYVIAHVMITITLMFSFLTVEILTFISQTVLYLLPVAVIALSLAAFLQRPAARPAPA